MGLKVQVQLGISDLPGAWYQLEGRGRVNQGLPKAMLPRPPCQRALRGALPKLDFFVIFIYRA